MLICSTKKLLDKLDVKLTEETEESIFTWQANLVTTDRKKTLILLNEKTGFVAIAHGLTKKEFTNIDEVIIKTIGNALEYEGYPHDVISEYLIKAPSIKFSKTKGTSERAKLSAVCKDFEWACSDMIFKYRLTQPYVSNMMNHRVRKITKEEGYIFPTEVMHSELKKLVNKKQLTAKVNIKMILDNFDVERTITIPLDCSFEVLHLAIQKVFAWQNYHLYGFDIYDKKFKNIELEIVDNEEAFDFPSDYTRKLAYELLLKDYLYKGQKLVYRYDFGDGWEHLITVEDIFESDDLKPTFVEGKGNALPEDVGGEGGYEEFLKIIKDPSHEDYEMMQRWANMQKYEEYNPNVIKDNL